jgi:hypothetical protein
MLPVHRSTSRKNALTMAIQRFDGSVAPSQWKKCFPPNNLLQQIHSTYNRKDEYAKNLIIGCVLDSVTSYRPLRLMSNFLCLLRCTPFPSLEHAFCSAPRVPPTRQQETLLVTIDSYCSAARAAASRFEGTSCIDVKITHYAIFPSFRDVLFLLLLFTMESSTIWITFCHIIVSRVY